MGIWDVGFRDRNDISKMINGMRMKFSRNLSDRDTIKVGKFDVVRSIFQAAVKIGYIRNENVLKIVVLSYLYHPFPVLNIYSEI